MDEPILQFNTCSDKKETNLLLKKFKEDNSITVADRTFYTLKTE